MNEPSTARAYLRAALLTALALALPTRAHAQGPMFPKPTFLFGDDVVAWEAFVETFDVNGDGFVDLVAGDEDLDEASIVLSTGGGSFREPVPYAIGLGANDVDAADLDGDGALDLVFSSGAILFGLGDGTFSPVQFVPLGGASIRSVSVADLDGDQIPDIVLGGLGITVLEGLGGGSFAPATTSYATMLGEHVVTDFDDDGRLDVILSSYFTDEVAFFVGNGDGTFGLPSFESVGDGPRLLLLADVDMEGQEDLLALNWLSDDVSVLLRAPDGSFMPAMTVPNSLDELLAVAVGDLDGDGVLDLGLAGGYPPSLDVLLGAGDGSFVQQGSFATGDLPVDLAIRDLDQDGVLDLATAEFDQSVQLHFGLGGGSFFEPSPFPTNTPAEDMAVGDLDLDGRVDVVLIDALTNELAILLGEAGAAFGPPTKLPTVGFSRDVEVADVDGDGALDIVLADNSGDELLVLLGAGDGTFAAPASFPAGVLPLRLALGDFDEDSILDAVVTNRDYFEGVSVLLGQGDGTLGAPTSFPAGLILQDVAIADMNEDGHLDLVCSDDFEDELLVLLGAGDGTFGSATGFTVPEPYALAVADFDDDGHLDVAAMTNPTGPDQGVHVLLGAGDGTLGPATRVSPESSYALVAGDVDGDGRIDLVASEFQSRGYRVLLGRGDGSFVGQSYWSGTSGARGLGLVDVDCNGLGDVLIADTDLDVYLNQLEPSQPLIYCTPKVSSAGCAASIAALGPTTFPCSGTNDFAIVASGVQANQGGLLFAGQGGAATLPFLGGTLCVQPPLKRGPVSNSGGTTGCDGSLSTIVNGGQPFPAGLDAGPGGSAWYQVYYRDTGPGATFGSALSDAIQLDFQ